MGFFPTAGMGIIVGQAGQTVKAGRIIAPLQWSSCPKQVKTALNDQIFPESGIIFLE